MGTGRQYPTRYVGDANPYRKKHVHDTANAKRSCTLHALEWARNAVPFDTLEQAYAAGYAPCLFCLPREPGAD